MHAGRGCSGTGTVYGIPRCTSQYSGNGPSLYEVMCISCWDEERGKENTATSVDSLIHLGTFGDDGSCGVHLERASPTQGILCAAVPLRLSCPLTSDHRDWNQTTWEKSNQAVCSQMKKNPKAGISLVGSQSRDRGLFQISEFKSGWFTFPGFRGFNL